MTTEISKLKAIKKLVEHEKLVKMVKKQLKSLEGEESEEDDKVVLEVLEHINSSIAFAIPTALHLKLKKFIKELEKETAADAENKLDETNHLCEIHIGPFTYGIQYRDSGQSITIHPSFHSLDTNEAMWPLELFTVEPHKNTDLISVFAEAIDDDILLNTLYMYLQGYTFDKAKCEYIENADSPYAKLGFITDKDKRILLVTYVMSIIYELHNRFITDDAEGLFDASMETLEGEYFFTVYPEESTEQEDEENPKDYFVVGFDPDKTYKMMIKDDEVSDELTELLE